MLTVSGLTKHYGGAAALDNVDLTVKEGTIHALLGPNGSGKSTLIGCLSGRVTPDAGTIKIGNTTYSRFEPRKAFAVGTAVIYQHFSLVFKLSVADNIFLGSELRRGGAVDKRRQRREAVKLVERLGRSIRPTATVGSLSAGDKQVVEIAKALRHEPQLLVLDEPTAALGENEARLLGEQLKRLRKQGLAILYVTHLLNEVFVIADHVTVLRDGRVVFSSPVQETDPRAVIEAIAPRRDARSARSVNGAGAMTAEPVLILRDFMAAGAGPVSLCLRAGEIVALFGLLGSGRTELLEGLFGLRGPTEGSVELHGRPFRPTSPPASLARGLALVPAERGRQGLFARLSALDNTLMPHFRALAAAGVRQRRRERAEFETTAGVVALRPVAPGRPGWTYSGGNQQKLVVGRWLSPSSSAQVLLLDEPTQGIDVGARGDIYELLRSFAAEVNRAVVFASSDPEEVQRLADRALVLNRGRVIAELGRDELGTLRLLELAHQAPVAHDV
jgi:ABC-type sugar transport system ATPase subunit